MQNHARALPTTNTAMPNVVRTGAARAVQKDLTEDAILGRVPEPVSWRAEVEGASFGVEIEDRYIDARELGTIALEYVESTDKASMSTDIRLHVYVVMDREDILAEVLLGSGIGKPTWRVAIDKQLKVRSCKKGIGRG